VFGVSFFITPAEFHKILAKPQTPFDLYEHSDENLQDSIYTIATWPYQETVCENRLNMLETAAKVNRNFVFDSGGILSCNPRGDNEKNNHTDL
jgi:hypothetical protein